MPAYSISYDLRAPGQKYSQLIEAIKSYGNWAKPLESYWIVVSNKSVAEVRDHLVSYIDGNDKLFVTRITSEWASWNIPADVAEWLKKNV